MAVDLATSGSLGYGIGLQAKVPDKTGLVLQLENQRLKRQALKAQEEEEKQKQTAKKQEMFEKALKIDTSKWHRTLVPKVQQAANEAFAEYNRLFETNPRLAENSRNEIINKFQQKVGGLYTTNEDRKQWEKGYNEKILKNEFVPRDQVEFANYLANGDDASLTSPWKSSMGQFVVNTDSTIINTPVGKSRAEETAKQSADRPDLGKDAYEISGTNSLKKYKVFDDVEALKFMNQRYDANRQEKIEDVNAISDQLYAIYKDKGFDKLMYFSEFTDLSDKKDPLSQQAAAIVNGELLKYNKSMLNKYTPAPKLQDVQVVDELKNLALTLTLPKKDAITGQFIQTTEEIPEKDIQDTWNAYKQSNFGQAVIALAGGEKNAKTIYENSVRAKREGMRQMYQPSGAGKAKQFTWRIEEAPPVGILNAENAGKIRQGMEEKARAGIPLTEMDIVVGKEGEPGLEQIRKDVTWRIDPKGLEQASYDEIPSDLDRARGWTTGSKDASFPTLYGKFRSVLREKNGKPKYIIIDETSTTGELLGNTWAVPYDLNTSQIINRSSIEPVQKKKPAQQNTAIKKYYTKDNKEVDVTGYSQDQINKAIKDKLIFSK